MQRRGYMLDGKRLGQVKDPAPLVGLVHGLAPPIAPRHHHRLMVHTELLLLLGRQRRTHPTVLLLLLLLLLLMLLLLLLLLLHGLHVPRRSVVRLSFGRLRGPRVCSRCFVASSHNLCLLPHRGMLLHAATLLLPRMLLRRPSHRRPRNHSLRVLFHAAPRSPRPARRRRPRRRRLLLISTLRLLLMLPWRPLHRGPHALRLRVHAASPVRKLREMPGLRGRIAVPRLPSCTEILCFETLLPSRGT